MRLCEGDMTTNARCDGMALDASKVAGMKFVARESAFTTTVSHKKHY